MAPPKHKMPPVKQKKAPRYTPVSKRQDKPDAVYWILRNHPEFADADIIKLIGTTKATIQKIRERSHWNATNIKAVDPVTLGLCSQLELDLAVTRVTQRHERQARRSAAKAGGTLKPVDDGLAPTDHTAEVGARRRQPRSALLPAFRGCADRVRALWAMPAAASASKRIAMDSSPAPHPSCGSR